MWPDQVSPAVGRVFNQDPGLNSQQAPVLLTSSICRLQFTEHTLHLPARCPWARRGLWEFS